MKYSEDQIETLQEQYNQLMPNLVEGEKELKKLVEEVLARIEDKKLVRAILRKIRIKKFSKIVRKAEKKGWHVDEVFVQLTDLIGARFVCNNNVDVYRFFELLVENLRVGKEYSIEDYIKDPKSDGYRALHVNVKIILNEWGNGDSVEIPCEIQIRTLLQDSWAELAHTDLYKTELDLPEDLRGRMIDLASNLTTADEIAQRIRNRITVKYQVIDGVNLAEVTLDSIAYAYKHVFGSAPSEHVVHYALDFSQEHNLKSCDALLDILSNVSFRNRAREIYKKAFGFRSYPSHTAIFLAAIVAATNSSDAAIKFMSDRGYTDRQAIIVMSNNEILGELPDNVEEFYEKVQRDELVLELIAEALEIEKCCSICGERIVDIDEFAEAMAERYEVDDYHTLLPILIDTSTNWAVGDLCSHHADIMAREE